VLDVLRVGGLLTLLLGGCTFDLRIPDGSSDAPVGDRRAHDVAVDRARDHVGLDASALDARRDRAFDLWPVSDRGADTFLPWLIVRWEPPATAASVLPCNTPAMPYAAAGGADCTGTIWTTGTVQQSLYTAVCDSWSFPLTIYAACTTQPPDAVPVCKQPADLVGGGCDCQGAIRESYPKGDRWVCDCSPLSAVTETLCIPGAGVEVKSNYYTATCPAGKQAIGGGCQGKSAVLKSVPAQLVPHPFPYDSWSCSFAGGALGMAYVMCLPP
jgi:hypothetical protein